MGHDSSAGEESEWKASNCELFLDLVFVVLINVINEPLEELGEPSAGGGTVATTLPWGWVRVLLMTTAVWFIWSVISDFAITARYYEDLNSLDSVVVLLATAVSGFMARASHGSHDPEASVLNLVFVFWYVVAEVLVVAAYAFVTSRKRSSVLTPEEMEVMKLGTTLYATVICLDVGLFLPAALTAPGVGLWFWVAQVFLKVLIVIWGNYTTQQSYVAQGTADFLVHPQPPLQLWQERFQLVVLISLGEIVAAGCALAPSGSTNFQALFGDSIEPVAVGALATAIAGYLLYFAAHPQGWKHPGELSWNKFSAEAWATLAMSAGLAAVGAAYKRMLAAGEAVESLGFELGSRGWADKGEPTFKASGPSFYRRRLSAAARELPPEAPVESPASLATLGWQASVAAADHQAVDRETVTLLCLATCLFLVASSVVSVLGRGPAASAGHHGDRSGTTATRLSGKARGLVRVATAAGVGLLPWSPLIDHLYEPTNIAAGQQRPARFGGIAALVPCVLFALGAFEARASAPKHRTRGPEPS